ncbi:MAG: ABC transporter permease [Bacteroidia bacterium]
MNAFTHLGRYLKLIGTSFSRPENWEVYFDNLIQEMNKQGVNSIGIVLVISAFMGAVTTVQTAYQLVSSLIPASVIGSVVSDSTILELAPTVTSLVLAGRIGSSIATEIGTMRVSEQIDALEVMGINSASFLVLPKIVACVIMIPLLIIIAMSVSITGGIIAGELSGIVTVNEFVYGMRDSFRTYTFVFALVKTFTFAFVISTVSAYQGYFTKGGALEVGQASTKAIVWSSLLILFFDYLLAQLFL